MKIDVTQTIKDIDDTTDLKMDQQPVLDTDGKPVIENGAVKMTEGKIATFEMLVARALLSPYQGEENLDLDKRMVRWQLFNKLKGQKLPVEITPEEATLIKTMVTKLYGGALVPCRIADILATAAAAEVEARKAAKANGAATEAHA